MASDIDALIDSLDLDRGAIVGIGLAAPGPIDRAEGTIKRAPSLGGWTDFPLRRALATATGFTCEFDNDATAAAIGEYWLGATDGYGVYASVYMGTGIGAGIVMDGTIYRGRSSNVGEIGHVTVDAHGELCPCGNRGCVELYANTSRVSTRAAEAIARGELSLSLTGNPADDFALISAAATRGDAAAAALLQDSADYLSAAIVSMVNLFDLELIVLAGSAFASAGSIYVRRISEALAERALARDTHPTMVRASVNGHDAAAVGAATLVLQNRLSPRSMRVAAMTSAVG